MDSDQQVMKKIIAGLYLKILENLIENNDLCGVLHATSIAYQKKSSTECFLGLLTCRVSYIVHSNFYCIPFIDTLHTYMGTQVRVLYVYTYIDITELLKSEYAYHSCVDFNFSCTS